MDLNCELVEKLLQSTGLSCDDLLLKLQAYRSVKSKTEEREETISTNISKDDPRQKFSANENSTSLTSNSVSKEESNQDVLSNDNSVILETKSSKIVDNKNNLEPECSGESSATSSSKAVIQELSIDGNNKCGLAKDFDNNDCQRDQSKRGDTCSNSSEIVNNTSVCDVTIERVSAENQQAGSSKIQNKHIGPVNLSSHSTLKETLKEVTFSDDDHSQVSLKKQERGSDNKTAELFFASEESYRETSPRKDVILRSQTIPEKETTKEEESNNKDDCLKSSAGAQEPGCCVTSKNTKSVSLNKRSNKMFSEKILVTPDKTNITLTSAAPLGIETIKEESKNQDSCSELSFKLQERDDCVKEIERTRKISNSFGPEESCNDTQNMLVRPKQEDVTLSCQELSKTTKEECNNQGYCLSLSFGIQERDNCKTKIESTSKITKSCVGPEERSNEKFVFNGDDYTKSSFKFYEQGNNAIENENNNKITKSCINLKDNFSSTLPQDEKLNPTIPSYKDTLEEEKTEGSNRTDKSKLSSEVKEQVNYETSMNRTNKIRKTVFDFKGKFNKTLARNVGDSLISQHKIEKKKEKPEDANTPREADRTLNCQRTRKRNSNIVNEDNTSIASSSKNVFEVKHKTISIVNKSLSSDVRNVRDINGHDYSNSTVNTDSLLEAENSALSDVDTERETSPLKTDNLPKSEENLRDVLRMQLSSLRNMKRSTGLLPTFKKTSMIFQTLKKKRKSCDINPIIHKDEDDIKESVDEDVKEKKRDENRDFSTNENSLVSMSDDTEFVILNVTGGVDKLTPTIESEQNEERMFTGIANNENENRRQENISSTIYSTLHHRDPPKIDEASNSSDSNSLNSASKGRNENSHHVTIRKNISGNFTQDPGINKSVKNSEKSPFVSDSLDDFLNESAELRISYAIPKLGAEDGIIENPKKYHFDELATNQTPKIEQENTRRDKPKLIKAKTLAEMRRHFEKLKAKEEKQALKEKEVKQALKEKEEKQVLNATEEKPIDDARPLFRKKRSYKRKSLQTEESEPKKHDQLTVETNTIPKTTTYRVNENAPPRNSYIIYNNKKLWMPCKVKDKCIGNLHSKTNREVLHEKTAVPSSPKPEQISLKKPSLLSSLTKTQPCTVKYKPGPRCKKVFLQNVESKAHWTTELKTLPKIYLDVVPEVQKPIDPSISHLLPVFDEPIITKERANFALSALKPKNASNTQESFNFYIPFNNKQEKMLVRKPFRPSFVAKANSRDTETDPEKEISKVINDLITYVEIKEVGDTIIKEDDPTIDIETFKESSLKTKTRKNKRNKLDLELSRLSCKVIDVATNKENTNCTKSYCRLGCVCNSLLCESLFSNHCQLVECMFGCKCPSDTTSKLTTENNSLSAHTVSHLEDKAKKNMAKVEKEFTQTFIQTDNDAILVGSTKVRRSTKPPKKYTDFVGEDVIFDISPSVSVEKEPLKCKNFDLVLDNLQLDDVIPFCLFHNVHSCSCKRETNIVPATKPKEMHQIPKICIVKTKEDQHKTWYNSCARIRTVFPEYKERNKTAVYKQKLLKGQLTYRGRRGPKKKQKESLANQAEQTLENADDMNKPSPKINPAPSKRKQSFNIREDVVLPYSPADQNEKEFALQRRKRKIHKPIMVSADITSSYSPIFDGEIKVSLKENKDMLSIIGNENSSLEYLRILPWAKLIHSYWSGKICIWAKDKPSSPLLCNAAGYFPPKNFISIRNVTQKSEIINWILTDSLPPDRPKDLMHLILTPKNMHFLIAGYCLKKISSDTTSLKSQQDLLNKGPKPPAEVPAAADPFEISPSSSPVDFEDVDVDSVEDTYHDAMFSESEDIDRTHTNLETDFSASHSQNEFLINTPINFKQQSVLRDNASGKETDDTCALASPELEISVVPKPISPPVATGLKVVSPEMLMPISASLESISRKNLIIKKSPSPRKGIASQQNTTRITTKRTYVKVDSMFKAVQVTPNKSNSSDESTPTIKQVLNAPLSPLNTSGKSVLSDARIRSQLSTSTENNENLTTGPTTPSGLPGKDSNCSLLKINSGEKKCSSPIRKKSKLSVNTENSEKRYLTDSATKVSTPACSSKEERLQTKVSDKETVSKKRPQDPLEITETDQSPPIESTEEPKQLPVRNNENKAKRTRRDPLEITESESSLVLHKPKHPASSRKSKDGDTHLVKGIKESLDNSNKSGIISQSGVIPSRSLKCTHKDMNNQSKTLVLTNKVFNQRKLYFTKDDIKGSEITVALPPVSKTCKWRMIYLNSDFTYLTFITTNYSIKYTDLMDVVKMSSNIKSTITLRNKEFSDTFKHPLFGIYCVHDYQDRLFIGPYVPSEKHNVETLRYLQGRLIDTQIFNKMVGRNGSEKNPLWLYETSPKPIRLPNGLIIDITEDDESHEVTVVDLDSDSSEESQNATNSQHLENSLLFPPFVEELTTEELKARHSINRYIMTNIPHLGYFDAFQRDSKAIEVFWPDGSKGYRFPNVTFAKNLLTQYLYQIFCPIPQDFKINVIIMTHLGVQINKPINAKYLSKPGPYFCGEFGICEKDSKPDDLLDKNNVPSIDSLLISHKEVQEDPDAMIRIFGLFLMSNEELRKHSEPYKILQWAISETYILKKLAENYESEKTDLRNIIRAKKQKIKEKRKEKRTGETPNRTSTNMSDTIEIDDSDEEASQKELSEVTSPTFRRISSSGRIETDQSKSRSILKSNVWVKPGRSLLKSNERTEQKLTSPKNLAPVKISLNNSNIVLKKNNLLITKLK